LVFILFKELFNPLLLSLIQLPINIFVLCRFLLATLVYCTIEVLNISLFISDINDKVDNISTFESETGFIGEVFKSDLLFI
jgi:hypothetical protein